MKQLLTLSFFLLIIGCKDTATDHDDHSGMLNDSLQIEKFYGIGSNGKVQLKWDLAKPSVATQVGIYRHTQAQFSVATAERLATISALSTVAFVDTSVTNGVKYYYSAVAEKNLGADGTIVPGKTPATISITPINFSAIQTSKIKYSEHIAPIFSGGCAIEGCHAVLDHAKLGKSLKSLHGGSNYLLTSWQNVVKGNDGISQVIPYRAVKSHLLQHLNKDTTVMPIATPPMPPNINVPIEIFDILKRWIDDGAKNDDGTVPFSSMPTRGRAFVTNQGEDITAIIDLDAHQVVRYITTGVSNTQTQAPQAPHNVVVDWQNKYYYVNLIGGSKLLKFQISNNEKIAELTTGLASPAQVALTKNSDTAYVSNFESTQKEIAIINTTTMTKIGVVQDPAMLKPHGVTITPDFKYILVINSFSDNVSVIQTSNNSLVVTIPISNDVPALPVGYTFKYEPYQAIVTNDSKYAFVTCKSASQVRVIDLVQLKVIDSITVGSVPLIPAITPDGNLVYVANRKSNSVSVIRTSDRKVIATIANVGVEPHGVAVSKDGKYVYVACENLNNPDPPHHPTIGSKKIGVVTIIDVATQAIIRRLEVGNFAAGVAVTH